MASTAISDPELMEERFDSEAVLQQKVDALAEMVRESRHFVTFTGAGVSTSAGIPDFRGPEGKWTREAQGKKPAQGVSIVQAYPTAAHMALLELYHQGVLKYLISQNCDGLHRRSGIPACAISELHGNCWVEICEECGQQHSRDFKCDRLIRPGGSKCPADHFTGRFCHCGGRLLNSTIDFGQDLPQRPLELAGQHSRNADLHLALGSSLMVSPACDHPLMTAQRGGKLVICNLQKTPLTQQADLHIYAKTDTVMCMLMQRLAIPIPPFRLMRRVVVSKGPESRPGGLCAKAVDVHDPSFETGHIARADWEAGSSDASRLRVTLHFFGHYREPPLPLTVDLSKVASLDMVLSFDPSSSSWSCVRQEEVRGQLRAPDDAESWRIPDYGESHREYCVAAVMKHRKCDRETASGVIKQRVAEAIAAAKASAGRSRARASRH